MCWAASAPLHWAGNFRRTIPFLLFWKCPPCQLAFSLLLLVSECDLNKDWIVFTCRYRPHHCKAMLTLSGYFLENKQTWLSKLSTVFRFCSLFSEAHHYYDSVKQGSHLCYLFKNLCMVKIFLIMVWHNVQYDMYFHEEEGALLKEIYYAE